MNGEHNSIKEGIVAGLIGATAIAVWFFVVDMIAGRPLYTPEVLGRGLLAVLGKDATGDTQFMQVVAYTIFHYVAFAIAGFILAVIVHQAERTPGILGGFLVLFVVLELGVYGLSALMENSILGTLAWWQVMAANLVAAILMFGYMWRRHPALRQEFRQALDGTDEPSAARAEGR
jgi:hypothetical protein